MTTLAEIFKRHGTDKYDHGYFAVYEKLPPPARMLEVGVYNGASLRAWREFWPWAAIVGMDTFERGTWEEARGSYALVKGDSRKDHPAPRTPFFDYVFDDGSHKPRDQAATFRNLWPLLASGGVYFIEDVWPLDLMCDNSERHPWLKKHSPDFTMAAFHELLNAVTGSGGFYARHDFRAQSGKPDSVLLEIRKP